MLYVCPSSQYFTSPTHEACGATCAATYASINTNAGASAATADCDACGSSNPSFGAPDGSSCVADVGGTCVGNSAIADAGATTTTAGNPCLFCAASYKLNRKTLGSCVADSAACATGYSELATGASTIGTLDCNYCATGYVWTSAAKKFCSTTCPTGSFFNSPAQTTCGVDCDTNYASISGGTGTTTIAANCNYCSADKFFTDPAKKACAVKNTVCTDNSASDSLGAVLKTGDATTGANCAYCAATYFWTSPLKTACVTKDTACTLGFASDAAGLVIKTGDATTGANCLYCAANTYFKDTTNTTCGTTCTSGYYSATGKNDTSLDGPCTLNADPNASTTTTHGSILTYSILIIFSIVSLIV